MGREADQSGLDYWVGLLQSNAVNREDALNGFASSSEFKDILASFGL